MPAPAIAAREEIRAVIADGRTNDRPVHDTSSLSHEQVNSQIGAPGDTVMTPPLTMSLDGCFR